MQWSLEYYVCVAFYIFGDTTIGFFGGFRHLQLTNKWPKVLKRVASVHQMDTQLYV